MIRGRRLAFVLIVGSLVGAVPAWAVEIPQRLESVVLDTFDSRTERTWVVGGVERKENREWVIRGSKFTREGWPRMAFPEAWPTALFDTNPDNLPLRVLGINGRFTRLGFNYIEIFPAVEYTGTDVPRGNVVVGGRNFTPQPIPIPGIAKAIDIWAWGSNHRFTLEIHIRDARGIPYVLEMGSLWFEGWRNLTTRIPTAIPQVQHHLPRYLGLTLTKIVVRTDPGERVDNFFVYLDHLKVLSDMHSRPFDGRDLASPEVTDRVWGGAAAARTE